MPFRPYQADDSITRIGGGSVSVPEGDYLGTIDRVTPSPEDHTSEWPFHVVSVVIAQGQPGAGRSLRKALTTKPDAWFGTGAVLAAVGIDPAKGRGLKAATYDDHRKNSAMLEKTLKDKPIGMLVGDDTYNGTVRSKIVELYPPEEYQRRSSFTKPNPPSEPPSGNGGAQQNLDDFETELSGETAAF